MRAIQVSRFGGPEVLELVDLPGPAPGADQLLVEVATAGINYADTHQTADDYLAPQQLPFVPGAEVVGRTDDGRRVVALLGKGGYAEQALAQPRTPPSRSPTASTTRPRSRWWCRAPPPGTCCARAPASRPARASSCTPPPAVWGPSPCSWPASWARPGSSPRRRPPRSATWPGTSAPTSPSTPTADDLAGALCWRPTRGSRSTSSSRWSGGKVFDASLAALAPFGRLATYGMASREAADAGARHRPDGDLAGGGRLLAGARPPPARRAAAGHGGAGRPAPRRPAPGARRRPISAGRGPPRPRGSPGAPHHRQAHARLHRPPRWRRPMPT